MNVNRIRSNTSQLGQVLSLEQVRKHAPSAFAEQAHESRSSRYAYIPTSVVIEGMMKEGFEPTFAAQSRCRDESKEDYTKHLIRFRQAGAVPALDGLYPEIVLVNSHDGTSAYQLFSGVFRLVCLNGLMTGTTYESLRVPHKGNVIDQVIEGSFTVIQDAKRAIGQAGEMGTIQLTRPEQMAFAETVHELRFEGSEVGRAITPAQMLAPRRYGDQKDDLFTVMNRLQESTIRGGLRGWTQQAERTVRPRRVTTRPVQAIAQSTSLNRALWTLAERMQQLKTPGFSA